MPKIKFALTILIVFVLAVTLTGSAYAAPSTKAKWTVMVYISGDNNLESYVISDIENELAPTGSARDIQVVALADRGPGASTGPDDWKTTEYFHVLPGMKATLANADAAWDANHVDELDMANPQTLVDFVTWTKANYPADHYALIFWGHGWNWHPGYVMRDDTTQLTDPNNYTMDYQEEKAAIPSLGFIDVVGYDGCNMSSIEIFNLWHGHATAVTGSQEYVGWEGLQYDLVLAHLAANPAWTADQLAIDFSQTATQDKTWSAVAVDSRLNTLLTTVDQWSVALKDGLATNRKSYDRAFGATRSFWQAPEDKDLYDMAYEINRLISDPNIKWRSQAVMDAVNSVVLYDRHTNAYADTSGITIYHISKATEKDAKYLYYRTTIDFALQTGWDDFLDAYAK
ncbi:MAG TPA: clostripain-related cysteine peptidase [Anaerolineales bacterium]|nr:clostripain-related cysteine peptidase [Anaerolineales bacterium]